MAVKRFASIDVGSFELELGIYEIGAKNDIKQIDHVRHVIALGGDTYNTGKISYGLVEEMCETLSDYTDIMKTYKVTDYRAYATSAMREAENNLIILDQIKVRTGIDVRIISNSEQRFISYKALDAKEKQFGSIIEEGTAIADVGFGSSQITLYDQGSLISTQNLSLGVLRIREMISRIASAKGDRMETLSELVDNELATYKKLYVRDRQIKNIIAIGETILYLMKKTDYINNKEYITRPEFKDIYEKITHMTTSQMEEYFGVSRNLASVLVPCAIIYQRIWELSGAEKLWLPGTLLVDGIAAEYGQEKKLLTSKHDFREDIISAARNMAKRYRGSNVHSQSVEKYALEIYDAIKKYHGLNDRDRLLLQIAAILHNCGKFISMRVPAECTYSIISTTEIIGLSHAERMLVAEVARNNLEEFSYGQSTIKIAKLTAILRLANSLDRSHKQKVKDYKFKIKGEQLMITTDYSADMTLEKMSFESHKAFFEEIFGIKPVLVQKVH